jgi:hypothetical protein
LRWFNLFIPRYFWPDKPRGIDVHCARTFYGESFGIPPGGVGQAYWEFNVFGVIGVFFLVGVAKRAVFECLKQSPESFAATTLYVLTIFYLEPDQNSFRQIAFVVLPLFVIFSAIGWIRLRYSR